MANSEFDLVIHNGTVVTVDQTIKADLAILGEKIAAFGRGLNGKRTINADGMLVLPGGVDPHTHLEMLVGNTQTSDDWFTGTRAAAFGGTTTVIDFVEPTPGETLMDALQSRRKLAESKATVDFGLHMTITNDDQRTLNEITEISHIGCKSFKTYLTYEGFRLSDAALLNVFATVNAAGGIVLVHAENDAIIAYAKRCLRLDKPGNPLNHALSRPPIAEGEAIQRSLALAEIANARVYIVHISTALGAEALRTAQQRGVSAFGETCPQYLLLSQSELAREDFEGAKFVCSPPLRTDHDRAALWQSLGCGDLQTIGTDHCPFNFHGQKDLGKDHYEAIPGGLPGIESRLALLHTFGVLGGRISIHQWVQTCSTNPSQIFGLYPRKGCLEPGADADIVLFDPLKKVTLTKSILHEHVDYTPYERVELQGYPVMTLLRGKVITEGGNYLAMPGNGRYLPQKFIPESDSRE